MLIDVCERVYKNPTIYFRPEYVSDFTRSQLPKDYSIIIMHDLVLRKVPNFSLPKQIKGKKVTKIYVPK